MGEALGMVETKGLVAMIEDLRGTGAVYGVPNESGSEDLYFSVTADPAFGTVSGWGREQMLRIFAELVT